MAKDVLIRFLESMESVYGPFQMLSATDCKQWTPPPSSGGHRGRYLWTDAFGVINFLTLYRLNSDQNYLHLADSLIATVHQVLGSTRNGGSRLPGATAENPLGGGLRIGKEDEHGPDADGQYHHYLTIWMFALNRMSLATGDVKFNNQAISLAKAIHPRFLHNQISSQPRMYWKMTTDMSAPLVSGEGNTDPLNGYAVFRLLQQTSPDKTALQDEINDYKRILDRRVKHVVTQDSLDIGMTLWLTQWLEDEQTLAEQCIKQLGQCIPNGFLHHSTRLLTADNSPRRSFQGRHQS